MPDKHIYEYAIIRYVPRVEREEFLNIGVILFCKPLKFLQVKYQLDHKRIEALAGEVDFVELERYLHTWELVSSGSPQGGEIAQMDLAGRFRWLTATRSTVIQSSKGTSGPLYQTRQSGSTLVRAICGNEALAQGI